MGSTNSTRCASVEDSDQRAKKMAKKMAAGDGMGEYMLPRWPSISVLLLRTLIALVMTPFNLLAMSMAVAWSFPKRIWDLLVFIPVLEAKQNGLENAPSPSKRLQSIGLAVLLTPLASLVGACLGAGLGIAAGFLWALYGPGAPEKPFSSRPAGQTRHCISYEEEKNANKLKKQYEGTLAFSREFFEYDKQILHCHKITLQSKKQFKGILLVQHGLQGHGGSVRSLKVGIHFAQEGFLVYLLDALGHGRSSGAWGVVPSFEMLARHLAFIGKVCHEKYPKLPIFLQGESMGGMIVLQTPQFMDESTFEKLHGIIAVCPAISIHESAKGSNACQDQFARFLPGNLLRRIIPKLPATPGPKGTIFSLDPVLHKEALDEAAADPLEYGGNTTLATAMLFQDIHMTEHVRKDLIKQLQELQKPLLLQHGTADLCVDIASSRELYSGLKSNHKKLIEYKGKAHVILSEDTETRASFLKDETDFVHDIMQNI